MTRTDNTTPAGDTRNVALTETELQQVNGGFIPLLVLAVDRATKAMDSLFGTDTNKGMRPGD